MFKIILPKLNFQIEKWKWNKEFRVFVSTLGNIKDENKNLLPVLIDSNGYCRVKTLYGYKMIHRLVMLTWKPIPNAESLTVDHLNHNKRENTIYNLEWVTKQENLRRANRDFIYVKKTPEQKKIEDLHNQIKSLLEHKNPNKDFIIRGGQYDFNSFEDAAIWLKTKNKGLINTNINTIKKNIFSSIRDVKKYHGYTWQIIFKI